MGKFEIFICVVSWRTTCRDMTFNEVEMLKSQKESLEEKDPNVTGKVEFEVEFSKENSIDQEKEQTPKEEVDTQLQHYQLTRDRERGEARPPQRGSNIFPSFVKFLKSKDPSDGTEKALLEELQVLDDHLNAQGPYVGGEKISAVDLSLGPKLFHLDITLDHFKGWKVPENLTNVHSYMQLLFNRESLQKTKAAREHVIAGWAPKVNA